MLLGLLEGNKLNSGFVARSNGICRKGGWGGGGGAEHGSWLGFPKDLRDVALSPVLPGGPYAPQEPSSKERGSAFRREKLAAEVGLV